MTSPGKETEVIRCTTIGDHAMSYWCPGLKGHKLLEVDKSTPSTRATAGEYVLKDEFTNLIPEDILHNQCEFVYDGVCAFGRLIVSATLEQRED